MVYINCINNDIIQKLFHTTPTTPRFRKWNDLPYTHSNSFLPPSSGLLFQSCPWVFLPLILTLLTASCFFHPKLYPPSLLLIFFDPHQSSFLKGKKISLHAYFLSGPRYAHFSVNLTTTYLLLLIVPDNGVCLFLTWLLSMPTLVSSLLHPWNPFSPGLFLFHVPCGFSPTLVSISFISFFTHYLNKWIQ